MKLPARAGGRNGRYGTNVEYDRITHKYYVTNNGKRITGGFSTREAAEAKKQSLKRTLIQFQKTNNMLLMTEANHTVRLHCFVFLSIYL